MKQLEVKGLKLSIGATDVIQNIDLTIQQGEIIAILGPSGCGKTSFLNVLSGISDPSEGDILIDGHIVTDRRHLCGYMFQDDLLFPWRNILDNVVLSIEVSDPLSISTKKQEANKLLDYFGLNGFDKKYPHQLSGGMRRRAAFVRTLLNQDRELFLFDEPTGGLDYLLRLQLQEKLFSFLLDNKKTAIIITHDVETAVAVADRVLIFKPRPTAIVQEFPIGLARQLGSATQALSHADFGTLFQKILEAYSHHGKQ